MKTDGTGRRRLLGTNSGYRFSITGWPLDYCRSPNSDEEHLASMKAFPVDGGASVPLCADYCVLNWIWWKICLTFPSAIWLSSYALPVMHDLGLPKLPPEASAGRIYQCENKYCIPQSVQSAASPSVYAYTREAYSPQSLSHPIALRHLPPANGIKSPRFDHGSMLGRRLGHLRIQSRSSSSEAASATHGKGEYERHRNAHLQPPRTTCDSKITWRLIPFLMLLYFVAFLDRINVGFAALTMNKDVGLTSRCSASARASSSWLLPLRSALHGHPSQLSERASGSAGHDTWAWSRVAMAFTRAD